VYLWVRRPIIEWALRRATAAEPAIEIRAGVRVTGLLISEDGAPRAAGVAVDDGDPVRGDVVVDALGRFSGSSRSLPNQWVCRLPSAIQARPAGDAVLSSHVLEQPVDGPLLECAIRTPRAPRHVDDEQLVSTVNEWGAARHAIAVRTGG
jgi:2-polyprenyl-6-methoxyphenol hydroxylase-like FAD-dependent oxidoreductase